MKINVIKCLSLAGLIVCSMNASAAKILIVPNDFDSDDLRVYNHRLYQQRMEQEELNNVIETYNISYQNTPVIDQNAVKKINRALQKLDQMYVERPGRAPSNIDANNIFYEVGDAIGKRYYQLESSTPGSSYVLIFTDESKLTATHK